MSASSPDDPKVYTHPGAALHGHKIAAQARRIGPKRVVAGSGKHRIQQIDLIDNAYCVIEKAFRARAATGEPAEDETPP